MIKIQSENLDKLVLEHYNYLENKFNNFPKDCRYSLNEVITAKPKILEEIAVYFDSLSDKNKDKYKFIIGLYKNFTTKKKEYDAYDLAKKLNTNVCPYCNINSTYTVITKNKEKIMRPEFDHFYDKASYPLLALSFYNLIPSCHTCNSSLKGTEKFSNETHINPYSNNFDNFGDFKFHVKGSSFYHSINGFSITLKSTSQKVVNTINSFRLNDRYQNHKDIVLELIQKREIYNDSYIDDLLKQYEGKLFKNKEDLLRLIACGYVTDEDIGKRPLSKLIKDISEQLELI